ncbi:hypothetical protein HPP92_006855 [Vanilla planifolia]|uniref:Protein SDA1 n=1 Tax=Vanilla planifolia TaxID=51239 RepID=A0A835RBK6_VANPL|nr:hypothetical protein HPP92_006855 [Vanilla planifolia]
MVDQGRPIDSKAKPKAFGEVSVANDVTSVELLKQDDDEPLYGSSEDEMTTYGYEAENDSSPVDNDAQRYDKDEEGSDDGELANVCDTEELNEEIEVQAIPIDGQDEDADDGKDPLNGKKRKLVIKAAEVSTDEADGVLSNEDFQRIKKLKENKEAKKALSQHGLLRKDEGYTVATSKIPSSEQLSAKRVNPVKLEWILRPQVLKEFLVADPINE